MTNIKSNKSVSVEEQIVIRPEQPKEESKEDKTKGSIYSTSRSPMEEVQNRQECLQKYNGGGSVKTDIFILVKTGHFHFGLTHSALFT